MEGIFQLSEGGKHESSRWNRSGFCKFKDPAQVLRGMSVRADYGSRERPHCLGRSILLPAILLMKKMMTSMRIARFGMMGLGLVLRPVFGATITTHILKLGPLRHLFPTHHRSNNSNPTRADHPPKLTLASARCNQEAVIHDKNDPNSSWGANLEQSSSAKCVHIKNPSQVGSLSSPFLRASSVKACQELFIALCTLDGRLDPAFV